MAITPKFNIGFTSKQCEICGQTKDEFSFLRTKSFMFPSGTVNVCVDCLGQKLEEDGMSWNMMDRICQYLDIPFEPKTFEDLVKKHDNPASLLKAYNMMYGGEEYADLDWLSYYEAYKELEKNKALIDVVPGLSEEKIEKLQKKWGPNYDMDALEYLENLYDGLLMNREVKSSLENSAYISF